MNVSFETAKKLKDAGFPVPMPGTGQFLYLYGNLCVVTFAQSIHNPETVYLAEIGKAAVFSQHHVNDFSLLLGLPFPQLIFAPTADDILRELGEYYTLHTPGADGKWLVMRDLAGYEHENPAESAALAWLATRPT